MKTAEELISIDTDDASAQDLLGLMHLAYTDVKKAQKGELKTFSGITIVLDMEEFGLVVPLYNECCACLAGCAIISRKETYNMDDFPTAYFLDSCRYISSDRYGYVSPYARELLADNEVKLPPICKHHSIKSTEDVLKSLEWIFDNNKKLMKGIV